MLLEATLGNCRVWTSPHFRGYMRQRPARCGAKAKPLELRRGGVGCQLQDPSGFFWFPFSLFLRGPPILGCPQTGVPLKYGFNISNVWQREMLRDLWAPGSLIFEPQTWPNGCGGCYYHMLWIRDVGRSILAVVLGFLQVS